MNNCSKTTLWCLDSVGIVCFICTEHKTTVATILFLQGVIGELPLFFFGKSGRTGLASEDVKRLREEIRCILRVSVGKCGLIIDHLCLERADYPRELSKNLTRIFWEKMCYSSRQQAFLKRPIICIYIYMYTSILVDPFWCRSLMQLSKGCSFDSNHDEPRWWRWRRRWSWYRLWSIWSPSWICMWTRTWAIMNTGLWNIVNMNDETYCW